MDEIMKAVELMESNQSEKALEVLEGAIPEATPEEKYTISELYVQWGYLEQARDLLETLLASYPGENDLRLTLASIAVDLDDDTRAIDLLHQIGEEEEEYVPALLQLADLYQAQGLFEVSENKLMEAKTLMPDEPVIDFAFGELLFSTGDYKRAITYYEKVLPESATMGEVSLYERLAEANAEVGNHEEALQYYQDVEVESTDTLFKYGFIAFQAGHNDVAINAWESVIEHDEYYHTVYYNLAKAYDQEKMPEKAYETAKKGLAIDAFQKELYLMAGKLAHRFQEEENSKSYVEEAIKLDPDYKEAILFMIEFLKEEDSFDKIIEFITDLKKSGAHDGMYEWELAHAYNELEDFPKALEHYEEAYNMLEADSDFLKEYAYFLIEDGKAQRATTLLHDYLSMQPADTEVEEYLARLEES